MSVATWLPKLSLRRPVTMVMLMVALGMIGILAYFQIPQQLFPSGYTPPFLYVRVVFPNSTPKETEEQIVRPTEELFATLEGLKRLRSWAASNHGSFWLRFDSSVSMTTIYNQIRDRLERLMPTFPEGVERYYIWKWNPDSQPIYAFGIKMGEVSKDSYHVLETQLFTRIRRIPGVSKVDVAGIEQPRIYIEVDRQKARSHKISIYRMTQQLRKDNFSQPAGQLKEGGRIFYVRNHNRLKSLDDLRKYPVAPGVKLGDIARIIYSVDPNPNIYRIDGKRGLFVYVFKESEANTVQLCQKVQALIKKEFSKNQDFSGFSYHPFSDQGTTIQDAINQLQQSALWGGLFALLILGLFLRHLRMTMLVTLAIPMSLLLTLAVLYFMGESLNLLSLMGLMLSVGMVVDNAIVVVENIARLRQEGMSAWEAAYKGTVEVALAVLMATSTTIVVFLPLILMSGSREFRFYMGKLGYPVSIALAASLLVALLFTPLGSFRFLGKSTPKPWPLFDKITGFYRKALTWFLRHRYDAALLTILILFSMQYPMKHMKRTDSGKPGMTRFRLTFTFTHNYPFKEKALYLFKIEKVLDKYSKDWGIKNYTTRLNRYSTHGRIVVYLKKGKQKLKLSRRNLTKILEPKLPRAPGVIRRIGWRPMGNGTGASIRLLLYGPDSQTLADIAKRLEKHLARYPAFKKAEAELSNDTLPELQFKVKRRWALRYQMPAMMIGGNINYALSSRRLRDMKMEGRNVPVLMVQRVIGGYGLHHLKQLPLYRGRRESAVPLNQLTGAKFARGPRVINRLNRKTFLRVRIATAQEDLVRLYRHLDQVMESFPMPEGYQWSKGFRFMDMRSSDASQRFALILSVTFVLLLMGILFESFILPFSVLISIPLAFVGIYWILYWTETPMDMMAGIGLVMIVGLVVNHAIVLVDRINQLRLEGLARKDAIIEAGCQRLRPILMTTLTTVFGLIPMALGYTTLVGISYAPLGRTVIGGLAASALFSLLIVPLFYSFLDDLRRTTSNAIKALTKK